MDDSDFNLPFFEYLKKYANGPRFKDIFRAMEKTITLIFDNGMCYEDHHIHFVEVPAALWRKAPLTVEAYLRLMYMSNDCSGVDAVVLDMQWISEKASYSIRNLIASNNFSDTRDNAVYQSIRNWLKL